MNKSNVALYEQKYLMANNYSPRTRESYLRSLSFFLEFIKESPITKNILVKYKDHVATLNVSVQTKNIRIIPVRSFLKFLNQRSDENKIDYKEVLTTFLDRNGDKNHITIPSGVEVTKLLSALKNINQKYLVLAQIAIVTGMRISEILSLKKGQVQKEFHVIGKGSKQRPIMCSEEIVEAVREYEKTIDTEKLFSFTSNHAQRIFRKASGGKITPHTLRHFFAIGLVEYGMNIRIVQELLGHSSIVTTQRYTQVSNAAISEVYHKAYKDRTRVSVV